MEKGFGEKLPERKHEEDSKQDSASSPEVVKDDARKNTINRVAERMKQKGFDTEGFNHSMAEAIIDSGFDLVEDESMDIAVDKFIDSMRESYKNGLDEAKEAYKRGIKDNFFRFTEMDPALKDKPWIDQTDLLTEKAQKPINMGEYGSKGQEWLRIYTRHGVNAGIEQARKEFEEGRVGYYEGEKLSKNVAERMAEFESGSSFWTENLAGWYETVKALSDLGIKVQGIEKLPTEIVQQDVGINYRHCVKLICDIDNEAKEQIGKMKLKYGPKIEIIDGGIKLSKLQ